MSRSQADIGPYDGAASYFGVQLRHIQEGTGFRSGQSGYDLQDIGMHAGIQASTVYRLVRGGRINPHLDTILRIAHAFDIEPAVLLPSLADLKAMVEASGARPAADEE